MKVMLIVVSFLSTLLLQSLSNSVLAQTVTPMAGGAVSIRCPSGRTAIARMQGTSIMLQVTDANGQSYGMAIEHSGGSPDPKVAIGNGSSLAKEVCG